MSDSNALDSTFVTGIKHLENQFVVANSETAALRLQLSQLQASLHARSTDGGSEPSVVDLTKALLAKVSKELVERTNTENCRKAGEEERVLILQEMLEESRTALRRLQATKVRRNSLAENALTQQSRRLSLLGPTRQSLRRKSSDESTPKLKQHAPISNAADSGRTTQISPISILPASQLIHHSDYPSTPPSAPLRTQCRKQSFACFDDLPPRSRRSSFSSPSYRIPAPIIPSHSVSIISNRPRPATTVIDDIGESEILIKGLRIQLSEAEDQRRASVVCLQALKHQIERDGATLENKGSLQLPTESTKEAIPQAWSMQFPSSSPHLHPWTRSASLDSNSSVTTDSGIRKTVTQTWTASFNEFSFAPSHGRSTSLPHHPSPSAIDHSPTTTIRSPILKPDPSPLAVTRDESLFGSSSEADPSGTLSPSSSSDYSSTSSLFDQV